jgi:hypothetical protein
MTYDIQMDSDLVTREEMALQAYSLNFDGYLIDAVAE